METNDADYLNALEQRANSANELRNILAEMTGVLDIAMENVREWRGPDGDSDTPDPLTELAKAVIEKAKKAMGLDEPPCTICDGDHKTDDCPTLSVNQIASPGFDHDAVKSSELDETQDPEPFDHNHQFVPASDNPEDGWTCLYCDLHSDTDPNL